MLCSLTLRKNNPPAGSVMRWEPGSIFSGTPSLYHWMVGVGDPSALQLRVAGSCRGTVVSMGCSTIRGGCEPAEKMQKEQWRRLKRFLYKLHRDWWQLEEREGSGGKGQGAYPFSAASVESRQSSAVWQMLKELPGKWKQC